MTGLAASRVAQSIGRAIAPRKPTRVSEWAAANRILSDNDINIGGQYLQTNEAIGYVVIDLDARSSDLALEKLAQVGGMVLPAAIGVIAERVGLRPGLSLLVVSNLVVAAVAMRFVAKLR